MKKLSEYNEKRDFKNTKEPKGIIKESNNELKFVVQHHMASREHYDFRLEHQGVLLSWAVPKGPSFNPLDKRLAIKVEDHPYEYKNFEGNIPKGQYGGGVVMIWDEGSYEVLENMNKSLKTGNISFILNGSRLKGIWSLVRMQENNWLLIKNKDKYAKKTSGISRFKTSVRTNLSMQEISEAGIFY